jgi:FKBP-type peptidyl-prolyl cis-trans isomerase SlyD
MMSDRKSVQKGDQVEVHYNLKLPDGTLVQSSRGEKPLVFAAGGDEVLKPISEGVIGMESGEQKQVTVPPERGFGLRDDSLRTEIPRSKIPRDTKEGDRLTDTQSQKTWTVRELKHEVAVLDANHPLAGLTVVFELELTGLK